MPQRKTPIPTGITTAARAAVHDRDGHRCVYCGRTDRAIELAHYVSRAQGGLGIPQNLLSLCADCHRTYDGAKRYEMRPFLERYLRAACPGWDENDLIYRKD